jgi:hypothetical protein
MRRYFFHTDSRRDLNGIYLASLADAKREAMAVAGRMICNQAATFWNAADWCLTVSDQDNLTLFQLSILGTEAPCNRASATALAAVPS